MSRRQATFTQVDVVRAIKAAVRAGQQVATARIERDGTITLVFGPPQVVPSSPEFNPWDN